VQELAGAGDCLARERARQLRRQAGLDQPRTWKALGRLEAAGLNVRYAHQGWTHGRFISDIQSALIPANLTTLAHFLVSSAMS
jgi:DNA-binding MarR family transcriptional regulator